MITAKKRNLMLYMVYAGICAFVAWGVWMFVHLAAGEPYTLYPEFSRIEETLTSGELIGISEAEVIWRFGEPSTRKFTGWDIAYEVGVTKPFAVDNQWLVLKTHEDVIVEATMIQD